MRSHLLATEHGLQVRFLLNANLGYTIDNRVGGTGWAKDATLEALKAGYRHLDCAWMYGVRLSRIPVPSLPGHETKSMTVADHVHRLTMRLAMLLKNLEFQDQKSSLLQNFGLILQHLKMLSYVLTWF